MIGSYLLEISGFFLIAFTLVLLLLHFFQQLWRWRCEARAFATSQELLQTRVNAVDAMERLKQLSATAWNGTRKFEVVKKVSEDPHTFSFYLQPHDRAPVATYHPGQYLKFHMRVPGQTQTLKRCYSLSDCFRPGFYRVSIKRATPVDQHPVSNFFFNHVREGDILDVEAPRGNFYLDVLSDRPIVLMGGGIGITPVLSMLNAVLEMHSRREVWFFFAARNREEYLFRDHLESVAQRHANVHMHVIFSRERAPASAAPQVTNDVRVSMANTMAGNSGSTRPRLVAGQGQEFAIEKDSVIVGRLPDCDVYLGNPTVSSKHAKIFNRVGQWFLEDQGSLNGTQVNGERISQPMLLAGGEQIQFAKYETLVFIPPQLAQANAPVAAPAPARGGSAAQAAVESSAITFHYGQRLTTPLLTDILPSTNYLYFICGPAEMMRDLRDGLGEMKVPSDDIRYEAFTPLTRKANRKTGLSKQKFNIKFSRSRVEAHWDPQAESLLNFAERHGVAIASGCCAGHCGECVTAIRSGSIEYIGEQSAPCPDESCLACVAVPKSDLVLDA